MGVYSTLILAEKWLTAYWRLGEYAGNVADSKHGNTGVVVNTIGGYGAAGAIAGDPDTAITFPGGGPGFFNAGNAASLNLGDVFSIEAWAKADAAGAGAVRGILSKQNRAYYLRVNASDQIELVMSQTAVLVASTQTITADGRFHHVVVTKNGADVHLYLDSNDVTGSVSNATIEDNANDLWLGTEQGPAQWWVGQLDEIALYVAPLSAAAVQAHYRAGITVAPAHLARLIPGRPTGLLGSA